MTSDGTAELLGDATIRRATAGERSRRLTARDEDNEYGVVLTESAGDEYGETARRAKPGVRHPSVRQSCRDSYSAATDPGVAAV